MTNDIVLPKFKTPWFVVLDTETTDIKSGDVIEVAALRVSSETFQVVSAYYSALPLPKDPIINEAGAKHYAKVESRCKSSLPRDFVLTEYDSFIRCPDDFQPLLVGYCIANRDLPILRKYSKEWDTWLSRAEIFDLANDFAYKKYPEPTKEDQSDIRSLANVATWLGISVDTTKQHNPLYDCQLTLEVFIKVFEQYKQIETVTSTTNWPLDPNSMEAIRLVKQRIYDPKYKQIICPYCFQPQMHFNLLKKENFRNADSYFYKCDACGKTMNWDGTKNKGSIRNKICDLEKQVIV